MRQINQLIVVAALLVSAPVGAQEAPPNAASPVDFRFINLAVDTNFHDTKAERWNAYAQLTFIYSSKLPFAAKYTNLRGSTHSLLPTRETSFTGTATLYFSLALWPGGEVYWVPELISEQPLSHLAGLGSTIQNFELQKTGSVSPTPYSSRVYLRHTVNLGGEAVEKVSGAMQLGSKVDSRRLVITIGNFSILDFFDRNSYASDLRRQFFNMAFLTHAAYDFAADARGYAWGAVIEYFHDSWAVRIARLTPPKYPNQLPLDFRFWQFYGDQLEVEHEHVLAGQPGAVRLLAFRNKENMGSFNDAVQAYQANPAQNAATCSAFSYASKNTTAPDLCWVRKPNVKWGGGINIEQQLTPDFGLFARAALADGQTEVYSYTATDPSVSAGILGRGTLWRRPDDALGLAYGQAWISQDHAIYLQAGGIDGFIGDGSITQACEHVLEFFYSANLYGPIWLSGDYQLIVHPAYNSDRGPVNIFGLRLHAEG